jgi:hypothetical protein
MQMNKRHSVPPPMLTGGGGGTRGLSDGEGPGFGVGAPTVGPTVGGVGPCVAFGGATGATPGGAACDGDGFGRAVERATGSGCELTVALGLGVSLGLGGNVGVRTITVRGVITAGVVINAGAVITVGAVIKAGAVLDDGAGGTACACRLARGVGVGVALPGIASMNGAASGSELAELPNPLRPDQLSANAVNATTTTANKARTSVERRGRLTSYSLRTGIG